MMEFIQTFESTVLSTSTQHAGHFVVIPKRSLPAPTVDSDSSETVEMKLFGKSSFQILGPVRSSNLGISLAVLLSPAIADHERAQYLTSVLNGAPLPELITPDDKEFGEQMAFGRMVPFENSPLELESLSKIVLQATGAGVGVYAGFIIAGPTPLLFVTVPAGMILFGAAKGIADALEQGLREKLLNYLRQGSNPESGNEAKPTSKKSRSGSS